MPGLHCCKLAFSWAFSRSSKWASHCGHFCCCRALAIELEGSVVVAHGLSCPTAQGIFLDQGLNPCPPAMAGGFLNTGPLGRSSFLEFIFSSSVTSWAKFPRFTAFYVNRACSSLTYLSNAKWAAVTGYFRIADHSLFPVPSSLGPWPSSVSSFSQTRPHFLSSDFSLFILSIIFDIWDQPPKSKQIQKCAIYGVQERQMDP